MAYSFVARTRAHPSDKYEIYKLLNIRTNAVVTWYYHRKIGRNVPPRDNLTVGLTDTLICACYITAIDYFFYAEETNKIYIEYVLFQSVYKTYYLFEADRLIIIKL